jgi:hypothetical protein
LVIHIDIFQKKFVWKLEINNTNCAFSNIFQKVKSYFFPNISHSPIKFETLKPPTEDPLSANITLMLSHHIYFLRWKFCQCPNSNLNCSYCLYCHCENSTVNGWQGIMSHPKIIQEKPFFEKKFLLFTGISTKPYLV